MSAGADYEIVEDLILGGQVTDFQLSYADEDFEAYAYVNNAFDAFYTLSENPLGGIVGTPREFGVGLRVRF